MTTLQLESYQKAVQSPLELPTHNLLTYFTAVDNYINSTGADVRLATLLLHKSIRSV